jgi:hypothetical protein
MIHSNDVSTFQSAVRQFGAGRYTGLSIGNEVSLLTLDGMQGSHTIWNLEYG